MSTKNPFDPIASSYDDTFTQTQIGRLQRRIVWDYLHSWLQENPNAKILELNCGTGEDALWLSQQGAKVLATDYSEEMVEQAHSKLIGSDSNAQVCAFDQIETLQNQGPFDLILSNFGGLNCLPPNDFSKFAQDATKLLSPNGHFIAVVMPDFCAWETTYFLAKGKSKKAFRRRSKKPVLANLGSTSVETWYFSPKKFLSFFSAFRQINCLPVGIFIPPSYLEPFFQSRPNLLKRLAVWDQKMRHQSRLAKYADHYLIHLQRENTKTD